MRDAGHRTPDAGHRTPDTGRRTSDGEKSKNNISTPQGGGHNNTTKHIVFSLIYKEKKTSYQGWLSVQIKVLSTFKSFSTSTIYIFLRNVFSTSTFEKYLLQVLFFSTLK